MTTPDMDLAPVNPYDPHREPGLYEAYRSAVGQVAEDEWAATMAEDERRGGAREPPRLHLPDEFWAARTVLGTIRRYAHAYVTSADAVFGCVLARLASMASPDLVLDFGRGPGSLNTFVALVGPSGVGKSQAHATAARLAPPPPYLDADSYREGIGLGSGEGLAEAYMGTVYRDTGEQYRSGPRRGEPRQERVRGQVRHNALFYVDEGEALTRMLERVGATIGPNIRSAWSGAMLGQANARDETTRLLPARSYAMGLVIGYQRHTAQPLLADAGAGTPQRFLWLSATDPSVPDVLPYPPGHLDTGAMLARGDRRGPHTGTITAEEEIRAQIRAGGLARVRGAVEVAEVESQAPLMRAKVASLLALLDGRTKVTLDDWALADQVWRTSCAVRDDLLAFGLAQAAQEREASDERYAAREARAHLARTGAAADVDRLARWLAKRVHEGGATTRGDLRRAMQSRDRGRADSAIDHATGQGWVTVEDRLIMPGESRPA